MHTLGRDSKMMPITPMGTLHLPYFQSVGQGIHIKNFTNRILQVYHFVQYAYQSLNTLVIQGQPVDKGS